MKKMIIGGLAAAVVVSLVSIVALAETGNGCPSGPHYNLNIIGVDNDKSPNMDSEGGHVIFVPLGDGEVTKTTKINLAEGDDFLVLDKNGTDKDGASFQLPNPDPDNDGVTEYSVYARPLGKPNGKAKMTTGAYDPDIDDYVYSVCVLEVERTKGKQKFENVSKELLYIYANIYVGPGIDGVVGTADDEYEFMRVPLFSELLQDYFWKYDNNGLKLLQLRFYEVPTTVPDADEI